MGTKRSFCRESLESVVILVFFGMVSVLLVSLCPGYAYCDFSGWIWLVILSVVMTAQLRKMPVSRGVKQIFLAGYLVRVVLAILQSYVKWAVPGFMLRDDQQKFLRIGRAYFAGDYHEFSTNFPKLLNVFFNIFGTDDFVIRVLFVYFWFLGCLLLVHVAGPLSGKTDQLLTAIYALLPWGIYITTAIQRESVKQISLMLSMAFLLKWMRSGRKIHIVYALTGAVPAIWLHTGEIAMILLVFAVCLCWDPVIHRWKSIGKSPQRLAILLLAIILTPFLYQGFVLLFPGKFGGHFSIQSLLSQIIYTEARTNYVTGVPKTFGQFLIQTPYRMIQFWVSPVPRLWQSAGDVIMFFCDVIPWILFFISLSIWIKTGRVDKKTKVIGYLVILFTFIYAWGTRNAGTALRHRNHLAGILIMATLSCKHDLAGCQRI